VPFLVETRSALDQLEADRVDVNAARPHAATVSLIPPNADVATRASLMYQHLLFFVSV
jgi:hypothetical protein